MFHFFKRVSKMYDISPTCRHLLILDGHGSHVTLEVIKMAMARGLDLLTFLSQSSIATRRDML